MSASEGMAKLEPGGTTIEIGRTFQASLEDVWELWTTKEGIESWWGPEGFTVNVHELDLRPGGELRYAMTATAPASIEFMRTAGMPLTTESRATYTDIVPGRRLAYDQLADFVPAVEPYPVSTIVEFNATPDGVRIVVRFDAMHNEEWTQRATMGHESQLGKLALLLDSTKGAPNELEA
jgi:uncharacterized protein YndB with AHSA1/START domain